MNWSDKTICILGGSGSFGAAFSKSLLKTPPKKLVIFSRNWQKQEELCTELGNPPFARFIIGDICNLDDLVSALKGIDILIHAAAIKNLPTCQYNAFAATKVNVLGTMNVVRAAIECNVNKTLFISTDKAVNAINTYGKCKSLSEDLTLYGNILGADDNIKFSVCRYGNVVNSAGSVVPVFRKLIEQGANKLPLTDEQMSRYWFSMEKAIQLVVDSLANMQGGEIFIPKMPSIWLKDLCAALNMPYKIVGIREGEKLHESIDESHSSNENPWFLSVEEIRQSIENI